MVVVLGLLTAQIWVDGVLFAAVLDDIVMQPLTGKMMAVLYRVYTPGGCGPCISHTNATRQPGPQCFWSC